MIQGIRFTNNDLAIDKYRFISDMSKSESDQVSSQNMNLTLLIVLSTIK